MSPRVRRAGGARRSSVLVLAVLALGCGSAGRGLERASASSPEAPTAEVSRTGVVGSGTPPAAASAAEARCLGTPVERGVLADARLDEISGLVVSRREPDVLWAHNDSGEATARFFALATDGTVRAEIEIEGAPHHDWEDVALHTTPDGREVLYFADAGDNGARDGSAAPRGHVEIVSVEPPPLPPGVAAETLHVTSFSVLHFRYPDGPHDCEAAFVDAATGDLYLLSKANEGPHALYRAGAPHEPDTLRTLERLMELLPGDDLGDAITAADADASGGIAIRTYRQAFYFPRLGGATVLDTLRGAPCEIAHLHERQGESIALAENALGFFTVSEGEAQPLHFVPFVACP